MAELIPHYEILCPPVDKRGLVTIVVGVSNPQTTYSWQCPVSGWVTRGGDGERARVVKEMKAHRCDYGWCPWWPPPGTRRASWSPLELYVDPKLAARYQSIGEARKNLR